MRRMTSLLLLLTTCGSILLSGCSDNQVTTMPTEMPGHLEVAGITYLSSDDIDLQLDIAMPIDGEGPFPAIVFIFGATVIEGSRHQYSDEIGFAANRGYVGVTIDYQVNQILAGTHTAPFPTQIGQAKCAIQWLRANADEYQIDKERIGIIGYSAGGYISLMLALTDPSDGIESACGDSEFPSSVQAAVGLAAPIDLTCRQSGCQVFGVGFTEFLGGTRDEIPDVYLEASPIHYVSDNDPPILSIMGELDEVVPPAQGELLDSAMSDAGLTHELVVLEGKGHAYLGYGRPEMYEIVYEFFDRYLK